MTDVLGQEIKTTFDAAGIPDSATDDNGAMVIASRNSDGSVTINSLDGMDTTLLLDTTGTVRGFTLPDGCVITPDFDEEDNITGVTDPNGNGSSWGYDAFKSNRELHRCRRQYGHLRLR